MKELYLGLAEIFEIEAEIVTPGLGLESQDHSWDSLAIISTIALVDQKFDIMLGGQDLANCKTVSDIEALIRAKQ